MVLCSELKEYLFNLFVSLKVEQQYMNMNGTESQWIPQTVKPELNESYCQIRDFGDDKFKDM